MSVADGFSINILSRLNHSDDTTRAGVQQVVGGGKTGLIGNKILFVIYSTLSK